MDKVAQGDFGDDSTPDKEEKTEGENNSVHIEVVDLGKEPPPPDFIMDLPNISSIDLYVSTSFNSCIF
jgi:splicing factor 3A subunit 1